MIKTKNGEKFSFIAENGLETIAPEGAEVYVHVTDNGNGSHSVNGKIIKEFNELGWVRTNQTLPSNTANILEEAHLIVNDELVKLNPKITFEKTL